MLLHLKACLLSLILMASILSLGFSISPSYGLSSGMIGQLLSNENTSVYVSNIQVSDNSGQKQIILSLIFKNLDFQPQLFNLFYMKMKDLEGREYSPEIFGSQSLNAGVPTKDTARTEMLFKLPSSTGPKTFTYTEFLKTPLVVDLTKTKSPVDPEPQSEWQLSTNKGFSAHDSKMELTINDELASGGFRVFDITIKNIGQTTFPYNPFYAFAKDKAGIMYSNDFFSGASTPLSSGDLPPGDMVRGQLAFKIPDTSSPIMFIWSGNLGFGSYFNTGELINQAQPTSPPVENQSSSTENIANPIILTPLTFETTSEEPISDFEKGSIFLIRTTIENKVSTDKAFVTIIDIRDKDGITLSLQFLKGKVNANDNFEIGASWIPEMSGEYSVRAFVVSSLSQLDILSPLISANLSVS